VARHPDYAWFVPAKRSAADIKESKVTIISKSTVQYWNPLSTIRAQQ